MVQWVCIKVKIIHSSCPCSTIFGMTMTIPTDKWLLRGALYPTCGNFWASCIPSIQKEIKFHVHPLCSTVCLVHLSQFWWILIVYYILEFSHHLGNPRLTRWVFPVVSPCASQVFGISINPASSGNFSSMAIISQQNMAKHVVQYLHFRILKFPLILIFRIINDTLRIWAESKTVWISTQHSQKQSWGLGYSMGIGWGVPRESFPHFQVDPTAFTEDLGDLSRTIGCISHERLGFPIVVDFHH